MRKFPWFHLLIILLLASCMVSAPSATPVIPTPEPLYTPLSTETLTPTNTPTKTPRPTSTPLPEFSISDVGLSWDTTQIDTVYYKKCYIYDETNRLFHAGDLMYFQLPKDVQLRITAPLAGTVIYTHHIGSDRGYFVAVKTDFVIDGKPLYFVIAHLEDLLGENGKLIIDGDIVQKGQTLGHIMQGGKAQEPGPSTRGFIDFGWVRTTGDIRNVDSMNPNDVRDEYIPGYTIWDNAFPNFPINVEGWTSEMTCYALA